MTRPAMPPDEATLVVDNGRVTNATLNSIETLNIASKGGSNNIGTLIPSRY